MPAVPFKANAKCRHHIPKQKRHLANWPAYEAGLCQRGDLTEWFQRGGDRRLTRRAADQPGRPALVFAAGHSEGADAQGGVPPGAAPDKKG
jgi:hypothetical protein